MLYTILIVHIAFGFLALASGGVALGSTKGATLHRRAGGVYVWAMIAVSVTAFALVTLRPNGFLFAVSIFSLYLVFTGWRAARLRDGRPQLLDQAAGAVMALAGLAMMGWGGANLGTGAQPLILLIFGAIGVSLAVADWRDWRKGAVTGKERIARHLSRMLGASIATITAAVTVNLTFLPDVVTWLGPTALLTPVIFWWNARVLRPASS